jgi:thioredoxin 1
MALIHSSDTSFAADVLKSEQPVVVDFYADWCMPCKMVAPIIESLSKEFDKVKFVKVDVDANPAVSDKFGIMSIPTVLFISGGVPMDGITGAAPEKEYRKKLDKLIHNGHKVK